MTNLSHQHYIAQRALAELQRRGVALAGLTADSRHVQHGGIFAAYGGTRAHGSAYVSQALAAGAAAVFWDADDGRPAGLPEQVAGVAVPQLKQHMSALADALYGYPSQALRVIGVTGTNGKTSCTHWLAQTLNQLRRKTAVIGTLGNGVPPALHMTGNTTPDAVELQRQLAAMRDAGVEQVAMEVSSEGIDQGRVNAVQFDMAVLTNLTRDHLDYHGDMAHYKAAKARLFCGQDLRAAVLNADDAFGQELLGNTTAKHVLTYGLSSGDVRGNLLQADLQGLQMRVNTPWGAGEWRAPLLGRFNAENLLAVLSALLLLEVGLDDALAALANVKPPAGRMQTIGGDRRPLVVVDYAHTPDALNKVLLALNAIKGNGQLHCVFGCGGDRDPGKRSQMGEIAARMADQVIVTSDNPRCEDPMAIIQDICAGMPAGQGLVEADRATAIQHAVHNAQAGDIVLIAGKGHENWQEIQGQRKAFDDLQIARQALEACP